MLLPNLIKVSIPVACLSDELVNRYAVLQLGSKQQRDAISQNLDDLRAEIVSAEFEEVMDIEYITYSLPLDLHFILFIL